MAIDAINAQSFNEVGAAPSESAGVAGGAANGYKFRNVTGVILWMVNNGVATPNVVVQANATYRGKTVGTANTIAMVSGGTKFIHLDPESWNDNDGFTTIHFTGSNETDVGVAVIKT